MYKVTQENYRMLNRECIIYTGQLKYVQDPIVMKKDNSRSLKFFLSFVSHEIQICRARGAMCFGWMWAFKFLPMSSNPWMKNNHYFHTNEIIIMKIIVILGNKTWLNPFNLNFILINKHV